MILLLLAIAIVLLVLRPVRERLEPTATIKDPDDQALFQGQAPYDEAEMTRIQNLVPGLLDEYVALHKQANPTATTEQAQAHGRIRFARHVAYYYRDYYAPAFGSADPTKIDTSIANNNMYPERAPLFKRLLMAYFFPQGATTGATEATGATGTGSWSRDMGATGTGTSSSTTTTAGTGASSSTTTTSATGTSSSTTTTSATGTSSSTTTTTGTGTSSSSTTGTIQVPNTGVTQNQLPYTDAEADRIVNLSQTAKTQMQSRIMQMPIEASWREFWLKSLLTGVVAGFYTEVYSTLTRTVQESDVDAYLTRGFESLQNTPNPPFLPEQRAGLKELLMRYYTGAAAAQGPSYQPPKTFAELDAEYQTKLGQYQAKVAAALASNDATALPVLRALNQEIRKILEDMLTSLDPLRQDTDVTRRQREQLALVLGQIERDYTGLQDAKDSMTLLRRIRQDQAGPSKQDVKLYAVMFAAGCLALFVIAMSKS